MGKPTKVYAMTVSLVIVWLKTWVIDPDYESDLFLPSTAVGYGTWSPLPPPETDRELLDFALVVVAHKHLGVFADVVVSANGPLPVVLVEDFRLGVVVAAGAYSDLRSAAG